MWCLPRVSRPTHRELCDLAEPRWVAAPASMPVAFPSALLKVHCRVVYVSGHKMVRVCAIVCLLHLRPCSQWVRLFATSWRRLPSAVVRRRHVAEELQHTALPARAATAPGRQHRASSTRLVTARTAPGTAVTTRRTYTVRCN